MSLPPALHRLRGRPGARRSPGKGGEPRASGRTATTMVPFGERASPSVARTYAPGRPPSNIRLLGGCAASVDVVISNCVINLSTDKPAVIGEIVRVLRPVARVGISDVVAEDHLRRPIARRGAPTWAASRGRSASPGTDRSWKAQGYSTSRSCRPTSLPTACTAPSSEPAGRPDRDQHARPLRDGEPEAHTLLVVGLVLVGVVDVADEHVRPASTSRLSVSVEPGSNSTSHRAPRRPHPLRRRSRRRSWGARWDRGPCG